MSVCLSVSPQAYLGNLTTERVANFLCMLPVATARSSLSGVVIRYTSGFVVYVMIFCNRPYGGLALPQQHY